MPNYPSLRLVLFDVYLISLSNYMFQMYRGRLKDGSIVAVRCLKMKKSHSTQNFMHHIELILKLRHRHLVSALGHCFECYLDDSSVSRIFFVFEYVPNGTLRSWISGMLLIHTFNSQIGGYKLPFWYAGS